MQGTVEENSDEHLKLFSYSMSPFVDDLDIWPHFGSSCWSFGVSVCTDDYVPEASGKMEVVCQAMAKRRNSLCSENLIPECLQVSQFEQFHNEQTKSTCAVPVFLAPPIKPEFQASLEKDQPRLSDQVVPDFSANVLALQDSSVLACSHCHTEATSLWRRITDKLMCNACALYYKLHGVMRPLHLNTGVIKRRNRLGSSVKRLRRYKC